MNARRLLAIALASACGAGAGGPLGPREVRAEEILEPRPPWIFFSEPDSATAEEIERTLTNSFADQSKVAAARDLLVRRFGLVSVPRLEDELKADNNVPLTWNSLLTVYALRDRFGPARELWPLLEPTLAILRKSVEPYRKAFAALALGSFHGPDTIPIPRGPETVLEVRSRAGLARQAVERAGPDLADVLLDEGHPDVRAAVALALGKRGADDSGRSRKALLDPRLWKETFGVEARQAVLLALGLLPAPADEQDDDRFVTALKHGEWRIRQAGALGIALQALNEVKPRWVATSSLAVLRALEADPIRPHLADGAEAVFARGVVALRGNVPGEWTSLFEVARDVESGDEAATAAVQVLLFCPEPWLAERVMAALRSGVVLPDPVVAAFLRIAGSSGTLEGLALVREYLGNKARKPGGDEEWDVRYHAAIGVLRAFVAGGLRDPAVRREAVQALDAGVRRGLPEGGVFRQRLEKLLELRAAELADPAALLPESDLRSMEAAFVCPYGLLAHEIEDLAILRLNALVPPILHIHTKKSSPGEPDKTEQPQRFLKACLERYPYFRRLELRPGRGLRAPEAMHGHEDPDREVREPK